MEFERDIICDVSVISICVGNPVFLAYIDAEKQASQRREYIFL